MRADDLITLLLKQIQSHRRINSAGQRNQHTALIFLDIHAKLLSEVEINCVRVSPGIERRAPETAA